MSYGIALQQAIYARLAGDSALNALVTGVYDNVPQGAAFPYLSIGEDVHTNWDTDSELGSDSTITIHAWSRYRGRKEVKEIQGAVYDALHRAKLEVPGYEFVSCDWLQSESFIDSDQLTRHGVSTYRILIEQV